MAMMGKEVRLARLVNPKSNKMMAITVDHAISRGIAPMTGIHDIQGAIDKIVAGRPDAMTMTRDAGDLTLDPEFPYCRKSPTIPRQLRQMISFSDLWTLLSEWALTLYLWEL